MSGRNGTVGIGAAECGDVRPAYRRTPPSGSLILLASVNLALSGCGSVGSSAHGYGGQGAPGAAPIQYRTGPVQPTAQSQSASGAAADNRQPDYNPPQKLSVRQAPPVSAGGYADPYANSISAPAKQTSATAASRQPPPPNWFDQDGWNAGKPKGALGSQGANGGVVAGGGLPTAGVRVAADHGPPIEVQPGDTLFGISDRYRVAMRALIETNGLEPPFMLEAGTLIYMPPPNIHRVEKGETIYSISRRYNVDTRSLALMNGLPKPWTIHPGQPITLPALARDTQGKGGTGERKGAVALARADSAGPATTSVSSPGGFAWPVQGRLIRGFGPDQGGQRNDGVNIAASPGATIVAASDGEVVYAGDELAGFGNLVLISHSNGWVTAYAHADSLAVSEGQTVRRGQPIGRVGASGSVTSPQLHFEIRKGKTPIDPTSQLPPLGEA